MSWDFAYNYQRLFASQLPYHQSINMVKVLPCKFQQYLGAFTMLLFEGSLETRHFRHWCNQVFLGPEFRKYFSYESHLFFWKCSKFKLDLKNEEKNWEKVFCFWGTCIWIGCVKLSLLRREYLPSELSVLGKCLEIFHVTNRDFLQVSCLHSDQ